MSVLFSKYILNKLDSKFDRTGSLYIYMYVYVCVCFHSNYWYTLPPKYFIFVLLFDHFLLITRIALNQLIFNFIHIYPILTLYDFNMRHASRYHWLIYRSFHVKSTPGKYMQQVINCKLALFHITTCHQITQSRGGVRHGFKNCYPALKFLGSLANTASGTFGKLSSDTIIWAPNPGLRKYCRCPPFRHDTSIIVFVALISALLLWCMLWLSCRTDEYATEQDDRFNIWRELFS